MKGIFRASAAVWPLAAALADDAPPPWLQPGPHTAYDGVAGDLVTGGLGSRSILGSKPGYADPSSGARHPAGRDPGAGTAADRGRGAADPPRPPPAQDLIVVDRGAVTIPGWAAAVPGRSAAARRQPGVNR